MNIRAFRKKIRKFEQFLSTQLLDGCCGITVAQCHCLLAIEELEQTTVGGLADYLNLDKSTLSRTVDSLVRSGFVGREIDQNDRRSVRIFLTSSGQQQAEEMHKINDEYFLRVFDNISNSDQEKVARYLSLFVDAISQYENEKKTGEKPCGGQTEGELNAMVEIKED